ncbi:MAG: hypothetical protein J2P37_28060 [Ktedonobacteraceae bacterium]|nr:hypothetical protein [Ktedonobacteraceae bacterium]
MLDLPWLTVLMRALHILSGAVWVGGSLMYLVVVLPALRSNSPAPAIAGQIAAQFKRMVNICIGVLLLSGGYLIFDRLQQTRLGLPYTVVLVLKIISALGMFILAVYMGQSNIRRLARRGTRLSRVAPQLMLALGIIIFMLGALLNGLYEAAIAPH